ncbi:hypothetical protein ACFLZX_04490 [Nanoarchaeota archaeon]
MFIGLLVLFAIVCLTTVSAEIVGKAKIKAKDGNWTYLTNRDDLQIQKTKLNINVRQNDLGYCKGPMYLFLKGTGGNNTNARLKMRLKNAECSLTENQLTINGVAKVSYKISQRGIRSIISNENGYRYGWVNREPPIKVKGEEMVFIEVKEGKAIVRGETFEIKDMDVSRFTFK